MISIAQAVHILNDRLVNAEAIGQAFELASPDEPPAWVQVYREQIRALLEAAQAVELAMNHPEVVD
ncbi:hypothetical protein [Rhodoferax sp. BAB1]|uniref:hypothetical protein n=1 Tax=Rhodoferax sp. BAB1 TaxID=2741720 RepID=UPI0015760CD8|nr:hypothetical protein [Rhodoferax sp. BAB1]QKO21753.1 hypothetical protein HTY51_07530 [Rhodoferax sp. BAB1]